MLFFSVLLSISLMCTANKESFRDKRPPLRMTMDNKFKIIQFTDLHFGECPGDLSL